MESDYPEPDAEALAAARERRLDLKEAVSGVEVAMAMAAEEPKWRTTAHSALHRLQEAFAHHVAEVESHDGLLLDLTRDAPRLSLRIDQVSAEHPVITKQIEEVLALAEGDASIDDVREASLNTLLVIARHRQHGADLVYQAYHVDIGGG